MFGGKKILIVEDSNTIRYEIRLILEKLGITVTEAANELGLFNAIEEYGKCVDLIIMDLTLKYENGFDLIEKLRQNPKYGQIPVLILTEHANKDNVLKAKELNVSGYLRKPIHKDELVDRVKSLLT